MTRILHIADLHYGHSRFLPEGRHIERQRLMGQEICKVIRDKQVELVIIAGDLAHRIDLSPEEECAMMEFLYDLDNLADWVAIAGNHDKYVEGKTRIDFLQSAKFTRGTIATTRPLYVDKCGVGLILLPYAGYSTDTLEAAVRDLMTPGVAQGVPIIVVSHEHFVGAILDSGYVGYSKDYPRVPDIEEILYWALGDIHLHQQIGPTAWYSGSPMQHTFGEKVPKGVMLLDVAGKVCYAQFIELTALGKLLTVETPPEEWSTTDFYRLVGDAQVVEGAPVQIGRAHV